MKRLTLVAVTMLVTVGCGSKDPAPTPSATTTAATPTTATPKPEEPKGKLSAEEYDVLRRVTVELGKLKGNKSMKKALRIVNPACADLTVKTELVRRIKSSCVQLKRMLVTIRALETQKRECTVALNAGDVSCYSYLFRSIGRAARVSMVRERAVNAEVRRRGLRGKCAKALVSSEKDLGNADAATHDAISTANAAERRDGPAFLRALQRLQQDFKDTDDGDSTRESLRKLKACV